MKVYMLTPEKYGESFFELYNPTRDFSIEEFQKIVFDILKKEYVAPVWTAEDDEAVEADIRDMLESYPDIPRSEWLDTVTKNISDSKKWKARENAEKVLLNRLREEHGFLPFEQVLEINLEAEFWESEETE